MDLAQGPFCRFPQQYAYLAKHPWLWKLTYELTRFPPARFITEGVFNLLAHARVRDAFIDFHPDLIVSVHPLVNTLTHHVLHRLVDNCWRVSPAFVTVVTDLGGAHPTWFHRSVDRVYVPSDGVRNVAEKCGLPSIKIQQLGLPVREAFWEDEVRGNEDKVILKKRLGLKDDLPVVLLIGGGDGVGKLGRIAKVVAGRLGKDHGNEAVQLVVICGKNTHLYKELQRHKWPVFVLVKGYVNNMSDWMVACDFLCTKAGPGTIAEALVRGLPLLLTGFLPGQEEANVKYVVDNEAGTFASRSRDIAEIASEWIANSEILKRMSVNARQLGQPQATCRIAKDILEVCDEKKIQNDIYLENLRRIDVVKQHLARVQWYGQRAHSNRALADAPYSQSLLLRRLRTILGIVCGTAIARDALSYPPSPRIEMARHER